MDARTFAENFELLAELPNGVKKLREMILQLAVRGKLVAQDHRDEPAQSLLRKVVDEKRRATRGGERRRTKPLKGTLQASDPFALPDSWQWCYLEDIALAVQYGYTASADESITEVRLLRITDIQDNRVKWDTVPGCAIDDEELIAYRLHARDLLVARTGGTVGKTYLVERVPVVSVFASYLIRITPSDLVSERYLKRFAESPLYWQQLLDRSAGTGQPNVNGTALRSLRLPLPPQEEQHRIVAKVDELMALCDELEAAQKKKRQTRVRLNGAALHKLTTATAPADFAHHWQRVRDHFDLLYDTPETVDELRQAVLQLAVRGKLVRQDPSDEPAEVLLGRIAEERERLSREGKLRKPKAAPVTDATELPHALPRGWTWARFGDVATIASDLVTPQKHPDLPHIAPDNIEKGTGRLLPYRTVVEDDVRSPNHRFHAGQIIYSKIRPNLSKAVLVDFDGLCSADMYPVVSHISVDYLLRYILSPTFLNMAVKNDTRVAMPKINQTTLNAILVAVPPLDEQHRIVAKVDELMALCDELEAKLNQARTDGERLMEAVVARLVEPAHVA